VRPDGDGGDTDPFSVQKATRAGDHGGDRAVVISYSTNFSFIFNSQGGRSKIL
jgi:hypothetical protein